MALASVSLRSSAQIIPFPNGAALPVISPRGRGRLPQNVIPLPKRDAAGEASLQSQSPLVLSFVADVKVPGTKRLKRRSFWHVPPATSYAQACNDGVRFAREYLAYANGSALPGFLGLIFSAMREQTPNRDNGDHGYAVGFCAEIERALKGEVRYV